LAFAGIVLAHVMACGRLAVAAAAPTQPASPGETVAASESPGRVDYDIGRLREFDDERLPIILIAAASIAIITLVWTLYRRDTVELRRPVAIAIMLLRTLALVGLLVFFLRIERRTTREIVHNSQVAVLVDVSQSMGLSDSEDPSAAGAQTRIAEVAGMLKQSPLMDQLRREHDVNVVRFDQEIEPVVTLPVSQNSQETRDEGQEPEAPTTRNPETSTLTPVDWSAELEPRGTQTRIGQALSEQLRLYRNAPLAGLIVISDGAQNAGVEPSAAIEAAKEAHIPIYTIGIGATEGRRNIAVRDLVLPTRAFPGDTLNITGYLQSTGYKNRLLDVELRRRVAEDRAGGTTIASQQIPAGADQEMVPVSFDIEPDAAGTFVYQLLVAAPPDDSNPRDNQREAEVEVVERKTRVLLFASGPMRDYQYLRNQLYRDRSMTVDVLLQSAQPGISQEANEILDAFPSTAEQLYQYDCIVAFDPDWTELDATQVELLEKWVSEEAGGLIVVAGSIQTGKWVRSTEHEKIRDLYPVQFQERLTLLDDGHYAGETAWPLEFDRAGREAKFLWLEKTAEHSEAAWDSFPGVYGYYAVKGAKPGATVYARFSDPEAGVSDQRPVYLANQFYGAGQAFYVGSGELWRLRTLHPSYFEVLYTKLIRHVSQGRVLRGSSRGSLLVERDRYELGEPVVLRARLSDEQHKPLTVESVPAQILRPDGVTESVKLTAEADKPGIYVGQTTVLQEGTYQVSLAVPGDDAEPLSRYLQVRVPDLERTHAQRNEKLLASIASETGGIYYKELETAANGDGQLSPLGDVIESRAEVKLLTGAPDEKFAEAHMQWLLAVVAGSLFLEWTVRRLNRLA
jgi:hypothetical protein